MHENKPHFLERFIMIYQIIIVDSDSGILILEKQLKSLDLDKRYRSILRRKLKGYMRDILGMDRSLKDKKNAT